MPKNFNLVWKDIPKNLQNRREEQKLENGLLNSKYVCVNFSYFTQISLVLIYLNRSHTCSRFFSGEGCTPRNNTLVYFAIPLVDGSKGHNKSFENIWCGLILLCLPKYLFHILIVNTLAKYVCFFSKSNFYKICCENINYVYSFTLDPLIVLISYGFKGDASI